MKKIQYLLLITIAFTQVSCFEIVELITLKNDGSGTFKYTINFSQSSTKIKSLLLMDEVEGYRVPTLNIIKNKFAKIGETSKTVKGISYVKTESNFTDFIFTYSCHFTKIKQINSIIDSLSKKAFPDQEHQSNYFNYSIPKMIFTRIGDDVLKNYYNKLPENQRAIFNSATFTSVCKFEGNIIKQTHSKALVSANKKAILHKMNISSLIKNGNIINKQVYLKK